MRALLAVLLLVTLAACQSTSRAIAPGAAQAACMGQAYLHSNGFLNAVPEGRVVLLDSDLRYEVDGVLQYERLVKERRNRFTRKLRGVWSDAGSSYLVEYGPIGRQQYCLGVKHDFSFAYMRKVCDASGAFTRLRERDLNCGVSD